MLFWPAWNLSSFARNWETRLREEILRELKETLDETFEKNAFLLSRTTEFLIILDFWSGLTGFGGFFIKNPNCYMAIGGAYRVDILSLGSRLWLSWAQFLCLSPGRLPSQMGQSKSVWPGFMALWTAISMLKEFLISFFFVNYQETSQELMVN